jgi:hypothetical protein
MQPSRAEAAPCFPHRLRLPATTAYVNPPLHLTRRPPGCLPARRLPGWTPSPRCVRPRSPQVYSFHTERNSLLVTQHWILRGRSSKPVSSVTVYRAQSADLSPPRLPCCSCPPFQGFNQGCGHIRLTIDKVIGAPQYGGLSLCTCLRTKMQRSPSNQCYLLLLTTRADPHPALPLTVCFLRPVQRRRAQGRHQGVLQVLVSSLPAYYPPHTPVPRAAPPPRGEPWPSAQGLSTRLLLQRTHPPLPTFLIPRWTTELNSKERNKVNFEILQGPLIGKAVAIVAASGESGSHRASFLVRRLTSCSCSTPCDQLAMRLLPPPLLTPRPTPTA